MSIATALEASLATIDVQAADEALIELARSYAETIDTEGELKDYGPKLLACLDHLLLTPKAKAAFRKEASDEPAVSPLDELRDRRRKRHAEAVDPTASGTDT